MDSRLAFYNCNHFRDRVYLYEEDNPTKGIERNDLLIRLVHSVVIDASGISYVDATALHVLEDIVEDHKGKSSQENNNLE